jgi:hypothetical protein
VELLRFSSRVGAYLALKDDRYPSTDEQQSVHLDIPYPDAQRDLNRWLPLVKWFLAIPHYIVLSFLYIAAFVVVVIAWFAILFTGRYPKGMFDFVEGVMRWHSRGVGRSSWSPTGTRRSRWHPDRDTRDAPGSQIADDEEGQERGLPDEDGSQSTPRDGPGGRGPGFIEHQSRDDRECREDQHAPALQRPSVRP